MSVNHVTQVSLLMIQNYRRLMTQMKVLLDKCQGIHPPFVTSFLPLKHLGITAHLQEYFCHVRLKDKNVSVLIYELEASFPNYLNYITTDPLKHFETITIIQSHFFPCMPKLQKQFLFFRYFNSDIVNISPESTKLLFTLLGKNLFFKVQKQLIDLILENHSFSHRRQFYFKKWRQGIN